MVFSRVPPRPTVKVALGKYGEPLVKDARLEKVFYQLQRLVKFPEGMQFTTQRQEPIESKNDEIPDQPALAVFIVTSPHPKAGKKGYPPLITTVSQMRFTKWVEANKEYRHYAFLTDPLRPIFAGLVRQHLERYNNLKDIID